jgi:hypothetical protein
MRAVVSLGKSSPVREDEANAPAVELPREAKGTAAVGAGVLLIAA